jgi:hypothetical protein
MPLPATRFKAALMKTIFIITCALFMLPVLPVLAETEGDERALALFEQAQQALNQGNLINARKKASEAITLKARDGKANINVRHQFRMVKVGRQPQKEQITTFDERDYFPNALLTRVESMLQQKKARALLIEKHKNPPVLMLAQSNIFDEDNNGKVAGLEDVTVSLLVQNAGMHLASDVELTLRTNGGLPLPERIITLKDIAPGASVKVEETFRLPKSVAGFNGFNAHLAERDNFNKDVFIPVKTESFFAPRIDIALLDEHSDAVLPNRPATLRYRLSNSGMGTARDLSLSLNFSDLSRYHIIKDLDLSHIPQLRPGESRDITLSVQLLTAPPSTDDSGLYIDYHARGGTLQSLPLTVAGGTKRDYAANVGRWLADRPRQYAQATHNADAAGLIINGIATPKPGHINNISTAASIMHEALGIHKTKLKTVNITSQQQFNSILSVTVADWLSINEANTLHVYLNVDGHLSHLDQPTLIFTPLMTSQFALKLASLYQQLETLPVDNIVLYLEAPFPYSTGTPALLIKRELPVPPHKISVIAAAMPGSSTSSVQQLGSGVFTQLLREALAGAADFNRDNTVTTRELQHYLPEAVNDAALLLDGTGQHAATAGLALILNTLQIKEE